MNIYEILSSARTTEFDPQLLKQNQPSSLSAALAFGFESGDISNLISTFTDTWFDFVPDNRVIEYIQATTEIDRIEGPLNLQGIGPSINRQAENLISPSFSNPFPALIIGGDGFGTDFILCLRTGKVVTLHHDATLKEVAFDTTPQEPLFAYLDAFLANASSLSILDLISLQNDLRDIVNLSGESKIECMRQALINLPNFWLRYDAWQRLKHRSMLWLTEIAPAGISKKEGTELSHRKLGYVSSIEEALAEDGRILKLKRKKDLKRLAELRGSKVIVLDLQKMKLKSFPEEVFELADQLEELNLNFNLMNELPAEISCLPNLTGLQLAGNNFTSLPVELGRLSNLEYLSVSLSGDIDYPASMKDLTRLRHLTITGPLTKPPQWAIEHKALECIGLFGLADSSIIPAVREHLPNTAILT